MDNLEKGNLDGKACLDTEEALKQILPVPAEAQWFIDNDIPLSTRRPDQVPQDKKRGKKATEWVAKAVKHAHLSEDIKKVRAGHFIVHTVVPIR